MTLSRTRSWVLALVVGLLGLAIVGGGALSVPVAAEGGEDLSLSPQVRGFSELDFPVQDNNDPPVISDDPPGRSNNYYVLGEIIVVDPPKPDTPRTAASHRGFGSSDHSCDDSNRYSSDNVLLPPCIEVRLSGETTKVSWLTTDRDTLHNYYRFECQRLGYGDVGSCADKKLSQRQQLCNRASNLQNPKVCPADRRW